MNLLRLGARRCLRCGELEFDPNFDTSIAGLADVETWPQSTAAQRPIDKFLEPTCGQYRWLPAEDFRSPFSVWLRHGQEEVQSSDRVAVVTLSIAVLQPSLSLGIDIRPRDIPSTFFTGLRDAVIELILAPDDRLFHPLSEFLAS